jgi:hypothetical protein
VSLRLTPFRRKLLERIAAGCGWPDGTRAENGQLQRMHREGWITVHGQITAAGRKALEGTEQP